MTLRPVMVYAGICALMFAFAGVGLSMHKNKTATMPSTRTASAPLKPFTCRLREGKVGYACGFQLLSLQRVVLEDTTLDELREHELIYCKSDDGETARCRREKRTARDTSRAELFYLTSQPLSRTAL